MDQDRQIPAVAVHLFLTNPHPQQTQQQKKGVRYGQQH